MHVTEELSLHDSAAANVILSVSTPAEALRSQVATSFLFSVLFEAVVYLYPKDISLHCHFSRALFGYKSNFLINYSSQHLVLLLLFVLGTSTIFVRDERSDGLD